MFYFDPKYILFVLLPGLIISGGASLMVRAAFSRYSQVRSRRGYTGAQAAQRLLDDAGIHNVSVVATQGHLSDHYNPQTHELALSPAVYSSDSLAAIGVACHEAGHAIQHAEHYAPLGLRSAIVPIAGFGSNFGLIMMAVGLFLHPYVVLLGAIIFSGVLLFQLVTLPVEFDATARAKALVVQAGIVDPDERYGIDRVLNAAALTYVAAVVTTLLTILYYLIRSGLLGGGRRD
ncbi:MAG: zinc metallopeptidase [Planctomycetaceae bacterium]|nr:zinc metallopeptidase [Planctomycetaceae bacterium]